MDQDSEMINRREKMQIIGRNKGNVGAWCISLLLVFGLAVSSSAYAKSATEIEIEVDETLKEFKQEIKGGGEFLKRASGVLVFPTVLKAGFVLGGEYGEGALRVGGKTVDYYSTAAGSLGFQIGAQSKSIVVVFMNSEALAGFRKSEGWKAGVDGSVALIEWGVGEDINTIDVKDPIVGFVFSNKGLMFNLNLEGSKFTRLDK
jgi:lipid-binding SYLF domain-containing protein